MIRRVSHGLNYFSIVLLRYCRFLHVLFHVSMRLILFSSVHGCLQVFQHFQTCFLKCLNVFIGCFKCLHRLMFQHVSRRWKAVAGVHRYVKCCKSSRLMWLMFYVFYTYGSKE